jgi:replication factor A1
MVDISELRDGMRKVDVAGVIVKKEATRTVNLKAGGTTTVANARLKNSTGEVKLVLWGADIDKVAEDSLVAVTNGYVTEYNKEIQLNIGRYGQLKVDVVE